MREAGERWRVVHGRLLLVKRAEGRLAVDLEHVVGMFELEKGTTTGIEFDTGISTTIDHADAPFEDLRAAWVDYRGADA